MSDLHQESNVLLLHWSDKSLYFSPVENCWPFMERKLQNYETSLVPDREALQKMWEGDLKRKYYKKVSVYMAKQMDMIYMGKSGLKK